MDINTTAQALPVQQLNQAVPQVKKDAKALQAEKVGKDFEAVFIHQMLELMSQGVETPETFGGGSSEGIFRSMMNEKIAAEVAKSGGLGVADAIENQIKRYVEVQNR